MDEEFWNGGKASAIERVKLLMPSQVLSFGTDDDEVKEKYRKAEITNVEWSEPYKVTISFEGLEDVVAWGATAVYIRYGGKEENNG